MKCAFSPINSISLDDVIPTIFSDAGELNSGIWHNTISFEKGNSYLIEAVSGKGKSSFCSYIYGYRNDYSGKIYFDNREVKKIKSVFWDYIRQREISLLFQDLSLFPELTALENIVLKNNLTHFKSDKQIDFLFDALGIGDKKHQKVAKISWGQQQRVAIIRCLCQPFSFLILDEPISHLDDENARILTEIVIEEVKLQGAGIITTSIGKHLPMSYTKTIAL